MKVGEDVKKVFVDFVTAQISGAAATAVQEAKASAEKAGPCLVFCLRVGACVLAPACSCLGTRDAR